MSVPMDPRSIAARLRHASDLADLRPERRLHAKLDMSPTGVARRLRLASELYDLCLALGRARPATTPDAKEARHNLSE